MPEIAIRELTAEQWRRVLLHELEHTRRRDPMAHWIQTALQIAYWWHPLVWLANIRIGRLREEAVDETVVAVLRGDSLGYCESLLAVARFSRNSTAVFQVSTAMLGSKSALAARLERLMNPGFLPRSCPGWQSWLLAVLLGFLVLPMAGPVRNELVEGDARSAELVRKHYQMREVPVFDLLVRAYRSKGQAGGTNAPSDDFWKTFGFEKWPNVTAVNEQTRGFALLATKQEHERFLAVMGRYLVPPPLVNIETVFFIGSSKELNSLPLDKFFAQTPK
jgi:hypothetical protein